MRFFANHMKENPMSTQPSIHPALDYHWTPANQRRFLEELAVCGNITTSAKVVSMSNQAAYAFRHRSAGTLFKMAWDAAALLARARLSDELYERAIAGQTEIYERDPDTGRVTRTRTNNALGMAVLKRLDEMALTLSTVPADTAMARIVASDFEPFLDLVSNECDHEDKILAASIFFLEREGDTVVSDLWPPEFARHYQLAVETADLAAAQAALEAPEPVPAPPPPPARVYYGFMSKNLRTNFPPPQGFQGCQEGKYGDAGYSRDCTSREIGLHNEMAELRIAPRRKADEAARDAYFACKTAELEQMRAELEAQD
jgi:hypothetical protein